MPKNACDEPIVLTEREQLLTQRLIEEFEDFCFHNERGRLAPERVVSGWIRDDLKVTEQEYLDLRAKFF